MRITEPVDINSAAPLLIVMLLKLVVPFIVALALEKSMVLLPALNVPLLLQARPLLFNVSCAFGSAFTIPPASIVNEPLLAVAGIKGSLGVVAASGIINIVFVDGPPLGVQFVAVIHDVLVDPFHVSEVNAVSSNDNSTLPKVEEKKATFTFDNDTQF